MEKLDCLADKKQNQCNDTLHETQKTLITFNVRKDNDFDFTVVVNKKFLFLNYMV